MCWSMRANRSGRIYLTSGWVWVVMITLGISSSPALAATTVNNPPTAKNVGFSVPTNGSLTINTADLASDSDPQDRVYISGITIPAKNGNAVFEGSIFYSPNPDYVGNDQFQYEVSDSTGATARGTVYLYVGVANTFPQATALNIKVQGGTTQIARLNSVANLSITVTDESGQPVPAADVTWVITQTCTPPQQPSNSAQDCTDFSQQDLLTDSLGIARAKLPIPNTSRTYDVAVSVSLSGLLFAEITLAVIASNLPSLTPGSPEAAMAAALNSMCNALQAAPSLTALQQELLARCVEIMGATSSAEVSSALRALAPNEAAAQGRIGNSFAQQQLGNIGARLAALRSGASGLGLAGLAFNIKGQTIPGWVLAQKFDADTRNDATLDLPQAVPRWGGFISGTLGGGDKDPSISEEGFNFRTRGVTAGADYRYSSAVVFGSALGYARSNVNLDANGGGLDASGLSLSLYGTYYRTQSLYLDAVLNYAGNNYDQTRNIDYTIGTAHIQKTARSDTTGKLLALSVGGGYEFAASNGASADVSLRLHRLASTIDGYNETGADELDLTLSEQTIRVLTSSLGMRGSWPLSLKWGVLIPQADLSWEHEFNDSAHQIQGNFVNDQFVTTFAFKTEDPDRDYFQLGLGASAVIPGGKTAFLQYQTTLGRANYRDYNVALGLRVELR